MITHQAVVMRTVAGADRIYGTKCGLIAGPTTRGVSKDPDEVTCKSCLRSKKV